MTVAGPCAEHLLAFADDEHLVGHRHTEWIGVAPFLEEDLAFASIGQDELGHAIALYELVLDDVEHQPFTRPPGGWRSCWLVERPDRDWAEALARHWLYDLAERHRWEALATSSVPGLGGIAARALREEAYHRRHAGDLVERLLHAGGEGRTRLVGALEALLPAARALFEAPAGEAAAVADGVVAAPLAQLEPRWRAEVDAVLADAGVLLPWPDPLAGQVGRTARSPHFQELMGDLTAVFRLDPQATW